MTRYHFNLLHDIVINLYLMFVVNIAEVTPQVHRHNPDQWIVGNDLQISWNQSLISSPQVIVQVLGYEVCISSMFCYSFHI